MKIRKKLRGNGRPATRGQMDSMYAGMRRNEVAPPPPPICPACTRQLDPGTGICIRCNTYPLLAAKEPRS